MRRSLSLGPAGLLAGFLTIGAFSLTIRPGAAAIIAPPGKSRPAPAKKPRLSGEVVESEALDLRYVVPDGWKPFRGRIIGIPPGAKTVAYDLPKFIPRTALVQSYYPPQFFAFAMELPEAAKINNSTPEQQDEMMKSLMAALYKDQPNFRSEGMARVVVNGEPATACAYVNTGSATGDLLRHRVVGMLRNHKLYVFGFVAEVDDFPALSPMFAKILQNFTFMSPRKMDVPPPPAPTEEPSR
jgi:hypothetical protein